MTMNFDINVATGQLLTKVALDKEGTATYTVMVTATDPYYVTDTDSENGSDIIDVTVTVADVEEDPAGDRRRFSRRGGGNADCSWLTYMGADDDDNADACLHIGGN